MVIMCRGCLGNYRADNYKEIMNNMLENLFVEPHGSMSEKS